MADNNISLIDPNNLANNSNNIPTIVNGIPQYQDMHIFVELTAIRKGRTVLEVASENGSANIIKTGLEETTTINFLGIDQNKDNDNPNYLKFTTNYYDGSTGNNIQYESFGISNIKITINSSFIPQIHIQFVDLRGLSFFNQENSPYRILFDFPPPIFCLTIKGYYGKALKYQLHLVKYTSEFIATNGNFNIDAQFVALTYAPLSDVLFRYIINFPLINNPISLAPTPNKPPNNTYELILKLKNLYSEVTEKLKTDSDSKQYDDTITLLSKNAMAISQLSEFSSALNALSNNDQSYLIIRDITRSFECIIYDPLIEANETDIITPITTLLDYNEIIKNYSTKAISTNIKKRLYIVYIAGEAETAPYPYVYNEGKTEMLYNTLNTFKTNLLNSVNENNKITTASGNIDLPKSFDNSYNIYTNKNSTPSTKYIGIDITDFYWKLYKEKIELKETLISLTKSINKKINNAITTNLGMMPSIYNVFKIILDDVDTFFRIIRKTAEEAENNHHNLDDYKKIILSSQYGDVANDKIYAFPLIYTKQPVSGGEREIRIAPTEISKKLPKAFPEIKLVEDFITTFFKQERFNVQYNMKNDVNEEGRYKWIPISPIDSKLASTTTYSPYINIDMFNTDGNNSLVQILQIVLDRFYVLTQNSLPSSFYGDNKKTIESYVNFYSEAEAINLIASITSSKLSKLLFNFANYYQKNIDGENGFYDYLEKHLPTYYDFDNKTNILVSGGKYAYVDKKNNEYVGFSIPNDDISEQTISDNSDNPIDKFYTDLTKKTFLNSILHIKITEASYGLTKENVYYIKDELTDNKLQTSSGIISVKTRFLDHGGFTIYPSDTNVIYYPDQGRGGGLRSVNKIETINKLSESGNTYFNTNVKNIGLNAMLKTNGLDKLSFNNIIDTWVNELYLHDDEIKNEIIDIQDVRLSALLYLSNFGNTLGPFNNYPKKLNQLIFSVPAAISVPTYLSAYIGALVDAKNDGFYDKIYNFFVNGSGKTINNSGLYIFADIADIENCLSLEDKKLFKYAYTSFINDQFGDISSEVQKLYDAVKKKMSDENVDKITAYNYFLNPDDGKFFPTIIQPLITRTSIINFSEITFKRDINQINYISLKDLNTGTTDTKNINNTYFKNFLSKLTKEITANEKKLKEEEEANNKLKGDKDIIIQTYYSFKNINDKWVSNPINFKPQGYPFNGENKNLIDSFAFVDRAMNPIGDTMINAELLIQLFEDPNISVFSVLSQLLSLNGFEFFPLQNFMSYTNESWEDSFKIDTTVDANSNPVFVCMFIGGASSYPTGIGNGFSNDGIISLDTTTSTEFKTIPPNLNADSEDYKQEHKFPEFPWRQVRAFRVKFGEQNQSMFTDIKIDSKEYPETNESIQILSRLAGDNKLNAPVPKGQNLYNLYENRAYRATITTMGNAMIQPTQYFQLENVPIFNGAYIILTVEHNIEPNRMMTNFSGVKILRYPVPRVTSPMAIMGFGGGDSEYTNTADMSSNENVKGTHATVISQARVDELKSVFGIDVSHHQEVIDWNTIINNPDPNEAKVKFAFIKLTQGTNIIDPKAKTNAVNAKNAGLKITYYHFGEPYTGQDVVNNAQEQASYFINTIATKNLPEPDFPLILDFENNDSAHTSWSINKTNNDLWINTFIAELKKSNYNTILYANKSIIEEKTNNNFGDVPLWFAYPIETPNSPEMTNPINPPSGWKDWIAWQFSWQGRPYGHSINTDLNVMKEDYFNSPKLT